MNWSRSNTGTALMLGLFLMPACEGDICGTGCDVSFIPGLAACDPLQLPCAGGGGGGMGSGCDSGCDANASGGGQDLEQVKVYPDEQLEPDAAPGPEPDEGLGEEPDPEPEEWLFDPDPEPDDEFDFEPEPSPEPDPDADPTVSPTHIQLTVRSDVGDAVGLRFLPPTGSACAAPAAPAGQVCADDCSLPSGVDLDFLERPDAESMTWRVRLLGRDPSLLTPLLGDDGLDLVVWLDADQVEGGALIEAELVIDGQIVFAAERFVNADAAWTLGDLAFAPTEWTTEDGLSESYRCPG